MSKSTSQLRKHLKYSFRIRMRALIQRKRLGKLGFKVFIDKNVSLLRFPRNIFIGNEVILKEGSNLCACNKEAIIKIGDRTTIGFYTFIYASEYIEIGDDCLIAPFVYIVDSDHSIHRDLPMNLQPNITAKVVIENDVWIATGAKILKGVTIGQGAVVAAGAVVTQDVNPYEIVGGIPSKVIGKRG